MQYSCVYFILFRSSFNLQTNDYDDDDDDDNDNSNSTDNTIHLTLYGERRNDSVFQEHREIKLNGKGYAINDPCNALAYTKVFYYEIYCDKNVMSVASYHAIKKTLN